jgi:predicted nucleotidyltransferase
MMAEAGMIMPACSTLTVREREALGRFKAALQSLLGNDLVLVRLFGSRARGAGAEESDIDVLVIVRKFNREVSRRIAEESLDIDLAYDTNLSATVMSTEEYETHQRWRTLFFRDVERESVPL